MSLINLSVKHGRTLEEARSQLETAVQRVHSQFGALIRQMRWSVDRSQVRLDGMGFWVEMWSMPMRSMSQAISPCWARCSAVLWLPV
jgi:hypothetical protein